MLYNWMTKFPRRAAKVRPPRPCTRLALEVLEARELPATVTQLTLTTVQSHLHPSISDNGNLVAFAASSAPHNGTHFDIFLLNRATSVVTQVTTSPAEENVGNFNINPVLSADGTRIVFNSTSNLTGGNPNRGLVPMLYDVGSGALTQITPPGLEGRASSISGDGTLVTLNSDENLTGGNADGNVEVFLYNTVTAAFTQVTNTVSGATTLSNSRATISDNGQRIALISNGNFTGGNADGNYEVFLYEVATAAFTQVTSTTDGEFLRDLFLSLSADGNSLAFNMIRDLTGGNPDGNDEIFLYDVPGAIVTQITSTATGINNLAAISADGRRIAFVANSNPTGGNPDGNYELYFFDVPTGLFTQVTSNTAFANTEPSISADGRWTAFISTANTTGGNPDLNQEVFLAEQEPPLSGSDFGDAPDPTYPTLLASDGPRHTLTGLRLGPTVDGEPDGRPNATATGDGGDENGVTFLARLVATTTVTVQVEVRGAPAGARLDAWIDWNHDGDWADPGEQVAASLAVANGSANQFDVLVPDFTEKALTFARFRLSTVGGLAPTGPAADGEVEDYQVMLCPSPPLVYVDDDWVGLPDDADPDGAGPATRIGFDAFATLQAAVDAVCADSTILVAAGTYRENVTSDEAVAILGAGSGTTFLDGQTVAGTGLSLAGGGAVTVAGFTVRNYAAGLTAAGLASLGLADVLFAANATAGSVSGTPLVGFAGNDADETFVAAGGQFGRGGNPADYLSYSGVGQVVLDGRGGGDTYLFTLGALTAAFAAFDSGGTGTDLALLTGTEAADVLTLTTTAAIRGTEVVGYSGLEGLTAVTEGGDDTVLVQGTAAALTGVYTGTGNDTVTVRSAASRLDTLPGTLLVDAGPGANALEVNEAGRTAADTVVLTAAVIYSTAVPFTVMYTATGGSFARGVYLQTGTGPDSVYVQGTAAGSFTGVLTGAGDDTVYVHSLANTLDDLDGTLSVDGGAGANSLIANGSGRTEGDQVTVTGSALFSAAVPFAILYTASGGTFNRGVYLFTGAGDDTVDVAGTAGRSFTSIAAGPGADLVRVQVNATTNYNLMVDGGPPEAGTAAGDVLSVSDTSGATSWTRAPSAAGSGLIEARYGFTFNHVLYQSIEDVLARPPF